MTILLFITTGLVVGLMARAFVPGMRYLGAGGAAILGVIGALVGGFLTSIISREFVVHFNVPGLIGSFVGAAIILGIADTDAAHHPAHTGKKGRVT